MEILCVQFVARHVKIVTERMDTLLLRAVRRRCRDPSSICCLRFSRSRRGCRRGSQRSSKLMAANECSETEENMYLNANPTHSPT